MDRREMLTCFGAVLGTASLGGCLSEYEDAVGEAGETTGAETTESETTTTDESPEMTETEEKTAERTASDQQVALSDSSFEVVESGCGEPTNQASVDFDAENTVGVVGTIAGSNACYTAELVDASYDSGTGTTTVTIASKLPEDAGVCADCITEIDYEATLTFDGGLPETVEVVHQSIDGTTTVVTADSN